MIQTFFLALFGISCGIIVASGIAGLTLSLSIIPRYAGITHTAPNLLLYETMAILGTTLGNIFYLFPISLPLGTFFLVILGSFFGIFLGSWILALAELISVFPVFARRIHLTGGFSYIILSIALGKTIGCFLFYFLDWT